MEENNKWFEFELLFEMIMTTFSFPNVISKKINLNLGSSLS